jgi:hypothetical protein
MTARAMLSSLWKAVSPGLSPRAAMPFPFFAAWPGAPVCWARGLERGAKG